MWSSEYAQTGVSMGLASQLLTQWKSPARIWRSEYSGHVSRSFHNRRQSSALYICKHSGTKGAINLSAGNDCVFVKVICDGNV